MNNEPRFILLDTHIWIWLATGITKAISPKLRALIENRTPTSSVRVSAISIWEVGMLAAKQRIDFSPNVTDWVHEAIVATGVSMEPINSEIALESTLLPGELHGDPADRILIATAKNIGATLITHDKEILAYSKKNNFSAMSL